MKSNSKTSAEAPKFVSERKLGPQFGRRTIDSGLVCDAAKQTGFRASASATALVGIFALTFIVRSGRLSLTRDASEAAVLDVVRRVAANSSAPTTSINVPPMILKIEAPSPIRRAGGQRFESSPIQIISSFHNRKIAPGSEAKAVLLTGATDGFIKARLIEPVRVDGVVLLEAGVLLLGRGHSSDERLFANFKQAVFKSGDAIKISAQAYDVSDLVLGLRGSRVGDATLKLAASSGLHFLAGMATGLQSQPLDAFGRPVKPSVQDAALNGVASAASEQARTYMETIKLKPPQIEVKAGTAFLLTFDGEEQ